MLTERKKVLAEADVYKILLQTLHALPLHCTTSTFMFISLQK